MVFIKTLFIVLSTTKLGIMSKHKKIRSFQTGDRVAEKPKSNYVTNISFNKIPIVKKNSVQRRGTIVKLIEKKNAKGTTFPYYLVKWDNNLTSEHAQCRLCFEEELAQVLENYTNTLYG